jgi:hypothetical protein
MDVSNAPCIQSCSHDRCGAGDSLNSTSGAVWRLVEAYFERCGVFSWDRNSNRNKKRIKRSRRSREQTGNSAR